MTNKANYRICNKENGKFFNAGTGVDSWFTLEGARKALLPGWVIVEICTVTGRVLWEVY